MTCSLLVGTSLIWNNAKNDATYTKIQKQNIALHNVKDAFSMICKKYDCIQIELIITRLRWLRCNHKKYLLTINSQNR